ncbi:hypothetical protein JQC92_21375 [Shewanella sp. 202IG2-18]|uniref:hypothetical protein n=1 Tax=Parashewanella hymeniacidonis TaxID=2807618 RepID=UPI001960F428|nr:hypothetical protein [Parashewanella hymeniacidonis]MBM7074536.1 hypothetical protein [Parashewanella hymeniacidonis]
MLALNFDQKEFASWLISKRIDILQCNSKGQTVVHWMIDNNKLDLLETVIMIESEQHLNNANQTPEEYAQALGYTTLSDRISKMKKPSNDEFEMLDEKAAQTEVEIKPIKDFEEMKAN